MKQLLFSAVWLLVAFKGQAQEELHIHHINIENGDATMIGIYNISQQKYTTKILIDGGQVSANTFLLPYLHKIAANMADATHFQYVILTHYHNDHYTGLLALGTGKMTADSVIDPGGYNIASVFSGADAISPREKKPDSLNIALPWLEAMKDASHHNPAFVKGRTHAFVWFGTTGLSSLGRKLVIGQVNNVSLTIECVAGWGNTLNCTGTTADPAPDESNANNFTLGFILTCGEFRYFIGGDLGGKNDGQYVNQEAPLQTYLAKDFPAAASGGVQVAGHICGYKANHHGSQNSNTATFMQSMMPAITVTSSGDNSSWQLPNPNYLQRLSKVKALSNQSSGTTFSRGVYITNLYNFTRNHSLDSARAFFTHHAGLSFDYGNNTASSKASYLIKVTGSSLRTESAFDVFRVELQSATLFTFLAHFNCHTKTQQ